MNSIPLEEIYVIKIIFHIFSFFLVFNHDFIIYIDFTVIAASNTATDDVINQISHGVSDTVNDVSASSGINSP